MSKKLYVGNLPYSVSEQQIRELFEKEGELTTVKLITDTYSGQSKGFAFVEMPDDTAAASAITKLNGLEMDGRKIVVNEARPPRERSSGGGGGGFRSGGGGGFGRGGGGGGGGGGFGGKKRDRGNRW